MKQKKKKTEETSERTSKHEREREQMNIKRGNMKRQKKGKSLEKKKRIKMTRATQEE